MQTGAPLVHQPSKETVKTQQQVKSLMQTGIVKQMSKGQQSEHATVAAGRTVVNELA